MVSLRELGQHDFTLHWHEAVALVAETAAVLLADGLSGVPDPESVILTPDGRLHLLDKGRLLNEGSSSPAPAPRLGEMLDALLSSSASPPELRRLVAESMADPPAYATIEDFAHALAFFERPGRHELLAALAARASEMEFEARTNTELERLEARTRKQPAHVEPHPEGRPPRSRRVVLVFAGSLLVSMVAGAILGLRATDSEARARGAPATLTERVRARVDDIAKKGLEAVGLRTPSSPPAAAPAATAPPAAVRKSSRRPPKSVPVTVSIKELTSGPISPPPAVIPESPAPIVRDEGIYSAEAEGVEPAVLMRQQLPSRPPDDTTSEEIGVLEIVVSATGAVEQVRLASGARRFQDRMIVAAAKAWRFEPATKDGHPVRYRTRIRVTL